MAASAKSRGRNLAPLLPPLLLLLLLAAGGTGAQETGFLSSINGAAAGGESAAGGGGGGSCASGPPKVLISSLVPVAGAAPSSLTLRNAGGSEADISSLTLVEGGGANEWSFSSIADSCESKLKIAPGASRTFFPSTAENACGFSLALGASGSLAIKGGAEASWTNAPAGAQLYLSNASNTGNGTYAALPGATADVLGVLRAAGQYRTLLAALEATGIAKELASPSDPAYAAPDPDAEAVAEAAAAALAFPSWFADAQQAAAPPPALPPKMGEEGGPIPPVGIPAAGPFTIFAPDDAAFDALLSTLGGGGRKLPRDALLRRPELRSILEYHVVPGLYDTSAMRNNTPLWTARGVEITSFGGDPCAGGVPTAGRLSLTDTCLNKPTPDQFSCAEQRAFDKCDFPFMSSALAAQWTGGFCGRACQRCSCSPDAGGAPCAEIAQPDLLAGNGVVHGITRVLLPPPRFSKQAALEQAAIYNATIGAGGGGGGGAAAEAGALVLPGVRAGAEGAAAAPTGIPAAAAPVDPAAAAAAAAPVAATPDTAAPLVGAQGGPSLIPKKLKKKVVRVVKKVMLP